MIPIEEIRGAYLLTHDEYLDSRGSLQELYSQNALSSLDSWKNFEINQTNFVKSQFGSIRGIHRTKRQYPQRKIITCIDGEILDVLVDLRPESPSFLNHVSIHLSSKSPTSILIPHRIGHSYQTHSQSSHVIYFIDRVYNPDEELGVNPIDEQLGILWKPNWILSSKDRNAMKIREIESATL